MITSWHMSHAHVLLCNEAAEKRPVEIADQLWSMQKNNINKHIIEQQYQDIVKNNDALHDRVWSKKTSHLSAWSYRCLSSGWSDPHWSYQCLSLVRIMARCNGVHHGDWRCNHCCRWAADSTVHRRDSGLRHCSLGVDRICHRLHHWVCHQLI